MFEHQNLPGDGARNSIPMSPRSFLCLVATDGDRSIMDLYIYIYHQKIQVPKMEVLTYDRLCKHYVRPLQGNPHPPIHSRK